MCGPDDRFFSGAQRCDAILGTEQPAMWKDSSVKKKRCSTCAAQKYIDIGEVRKNRCVADHIKGDKFENIATGCAKFEEFGKVEKSENYKSILPAEYCEWDQQREIRSCTAITLTSLMSEWCATCVILETVGSSCMWEVFTALGANTCRS